MADSIFKLTGCSGDIANCEVYRSSIPLAIGSEQYNLVDDEYRKDKAQDIADMVGLLCAQCRVLVTEFIPDDRVRKSFRGLFTVAETVAEPDTL